MKDIQTRADVELLVRAFYEKAVKDPVIGFTFSEMLEFGIEKHIPTMVDFWEGVLFNKSIYKGGILYKHFMINGKHPLEQVHFDTWIQLWNETVEELFEGPVAQDAIDRALKVGQVIHKKLAVFMPAKAG